MKEKIHYVIEAALAVAVIILFILFFAGNKKSSNTDRIVSNIENVSEFMSIAYIDIDSLMSTYTYSIEVTELLTRKYESAQATLAERARRFQAAYTEFQRKVETGAFLNRERAENEQQQIIKMNEDLQALESRLMQELDEERYSLQVDLRKTLITQVEAYNKEKGYHVIYGKMSDNILYANEAYNITSEVIEFLNKQYAASPALKPNE